MDQWTMLVDSAATDVNSRFGRHLMGLPFTWIGALQPKDAERSTKKSLSLLRRLPKPWSEWHYWWQAHYLDAIVDTGFMFHESGSPASARVELERGQKLLRGILIRNFGRFPNYFYDDMAWLALASYRLNELSLSVDRRPARLAQFAVKSLTKQLHNAHDSVLEGGLYWSRKRDFKNVPVNGPAALHFARMGDLDMAMSLVDWLKKSAFDPTSGLYLDGIRLTTPEHTVERNIYTYNQGTALGALLGVGQQIHLDQACELITAVHSQLCVPELGLKLESGGDGGLFTGILCRYLALAVQDERLPLESREQAAQLVWDTAHRLKAEVPSRLSTAVQRWTIFSAAQRCAEALSH